MLALAGWLPVWDLERRRIDLEQVIAWTRARLAEHGISAPLDELRVSSQTARALARDLTRASLDPDLRRALHSALREMLPELPWQHVLVQTYTHFRILCPDDRTSPVPSHCDHGFGHALDERNLWLALTDARGSAALHMIDLETSLSRLIAAGTTDGVIDEPALAPVEVERGEALLFTPLHLHAARTPETHSRVSIDIRIVPAHTNARGPSFTRLWA